MVHALSGCSSAPLPADDKPAAFYNFFIAGYSVENRPIECHVLGDGPDCVLIIGSIHGDETAGTPLARRLSHYLMMNPHRLLGRRVVILPAVNPDGMAHNSRENVNGVDLNRNFPAANRENSDRYGWAELSEPEAQVIATVIDLYFPNRVLTLHQPLACVDYDGPAQELAQRIATLANLPVKKLGARPGSLGAFLGEALEVPVITLELPRGVETWNETRLWERYGSAMVVSVIFPDSIESELVTGQVKAKTKSAEKKTPAKGSAK
jgi:protein MpaA